VIGGLHPGRPITALVQQSVIQGDEAAWPPRQPLAL